MNSNTYFIYRSTLGKNKSNDEMSKNNWRTIYYPIKSITFPENRAISPSQYKHRVKANSKIMQAISLRRAINLRTSQDSKRTKDEGLMIYSSSLGNESCFLLTEDIQSSEEAAKVMNNEMISQQRSIRRTRQKDNICNLILKARVLKLINKRQTQKLIRNLDHLFLKQELEINPYMMLRTFIFRIMINNYILMDLGNKEQVENYEAQMLALRCKAFNKHQKQQDFQKKKANLFKTNDSKDSKTELNNLHKEVEDKGQNHKISKVKFINLEERVDLPPQKPKSLSPVKRKISIIFYDCSGKDDEFNMDTKNKILNVTKEIVYPFKPAVNTRNRNTNLENPILIAIENGSIGFTSSHLMIQQKTQNNVKESTTIGFNKCSKQLMRKSQQKFMNKTFVVPTFYSLEKGEINKVHNNESQFDINKNTICPDSDFDYKNDAKDRSNDNEQISKRSLSGSNDNKAIMALRHQQQRSKFCSGFRNSKYSKNSMQKSNITQEDKSNILKDKQLNSMDIWHVINNFIGEEIEKESCQCHKDYYKKYFLFEKHPCILHYSITRNFQLTKIFTASFP